MDGGARVSSQRRRSIRSGVSERDDAGDGNGNRCVGAKVGVVIWTRDVVDVDARQPRDATDRTAREGEDGCQKSPG